MTPGDYVATTAATVVLLLQEKVAGITSVPRALNCASPPAISLSYIPSTVY